MTRRRRRIDLVVMLVFCSLGQSGDAQTSQETRAAFVLLSQLETVAYARSDFLFSPDAFDLSRVDPENNLRFPFIELIGGIKALGPNTGSNLAKFYRGYLVGAKDFGFGTSAKPDELGMVGSRQCFVGILEGGPQPNLEREFSQTSHVTMSGVQVWSWSIPPSENESEPTTYYAAQIGSSYLVIANDRQVFQDAANALRRTLSSKPRSITVFGWETFSKYNYWIYRLFRRAGVIDPESAGISDLSQDVSAITVFTNVDERQAVVQVFSFDTTMKTLPNIIPENILFRPEKAGVWQTTIPLPENDEAGATVVSQLLYRFGFGVNL